MGIPNSTVQNLQTQSYPLDNVFKPQTKPVIVTKQIRYVCIGINYSKTQVALSGCIKDAQMMRDFIKTKGAMGILLSDDSDPDGEMYPSRKNILRAIQWGLSSATIEDYLDPTIEDFPVMKEGTVCFISYSGHGSSVMDVNGDEDDGRDEVICPIGVDGQLDPFIVDDTLGEIFRARCKKDCNVVILTDSCHSGSNSDLRYAIQGRRFVENKSGVITSGPIFHIAGSKDSQYSYEDGNGGYLTAAFLHTMRTAPKSTLITIHTRIQSYLSTRIAPGSQLPQMSTGHKASITDTFPF